MQAIVRSEYGGPNVLRLEDVPKPAPGHNEVLVRVRASSVGMADVDYMLGRPTMARLGTGLRRPRDTGLGLDVAGEVESVGSDVSRFRSGTKVFGDMTQYGSGAYAEYVCAPEEAFAPMPSGLTFEQAATIPQAGVMALQGLRGKRQVRTGHTVLINGAGGNVGPFAVQIAKALGAEVTGVDESSKLEMLRSIGADHVIDYTKQDYTAAGRRYDWILDIAPSYPLRKVRRALEPAGVYSMIPATMPQVFRALVIAPLRSVATRQRLGMLMWKPFAREDVVALTKLVETGQLTPVIDRSYPLRDAAEALRYQYEGQTQGKIVLTV